MLPRDQDIRNLALYAPKIAYGMVAGVPRVPFVGPITTTPNVQSPITPIEFDANWVAPNAPASNNIGINPIVQGALVNNVDYDTLIERIVFSLWQPSSFTSPASPFQTLYLSMLKSTTGIDIQLDHYGAPKYRVSDFVPLENLADVLAITWPNGWPLAKQANVKVQAVMTRAQPSVPYILNLSLVGWQFVDKSLDDMSVSECRSRLRAMGIASPEVA